MRPATPSRTVAINEVSGIIFSKVDILHGPTAFAHKTYATLAKLIQKDYINPPSGVPFDRSTLSKDEKGEANQAQIVDELLGGLRNGFFIESGAADGLYHSNTLFLETQRNWTGILIEPNPSQFQVLQKAKRNCHSLQGCLSVHNYAEEVTFLNAGHVGGIKGVNVPRSISQQRTWSNYRRISFESRVQCFPLYSILLALGNPRVDLLSLDVEGAELEILQTIPWDKVDIGVILVEVDPWSKHAIHNILALHGYVFIRSIRGQDRLFQKRRPGVSHQKLFTMFDEA
ncbi:hypothetical protein TCAL_11452 [Tigriopus californicus]|uniref:Methyltransferase FkbM domain-containing protein n=2 Tax=Tigriopus californicus TaxID=6832 RepID=A0A553P3S6_TIGCA|nr:hypothetical protein TCAL_11452 [Tigriopus californicus]